MAENRPQTTKMLNLYPLFLEVLIRSVKLDLCVPLFLFFEYLTSIH